MAAQPRVPKNIVICCDGTGNKFSTDNSNVVKLYTCLRIDEEQVGYYHPGVGTMGDSRRATWLGRQISVIRGLAFASGFQANLGDAYKYLMDKYADGDRIYLFGFSRGAYTVRALAGMLYMYGLLCPGNEGHLPYVLQMFSEESRRAFKRQKRRKQEEPQDPHPGPNKLHVNSTAQAFRETFSRQVPVHFVGIWDTVSSIGWIYTPVKLLFDGQNPIVRTARHAVSVDERRCFYQANLLGPALPPTQTILDPDTQQPLVQDVLQVWFAGVHSDVGGSYSQAEAGPALDPLLWMLQEAHKAGVLLQPYKLRAVLGAEAGGTFGDLPGAETSCDAIRRLNRTVAKHHKLHKSLTWKWWPLEIFPHKYFDQTGQPRLRISPRPHLRELPNGALLHPTLLEWLDGTRRGEEAYRPANVLKNRVTRYVPNEGDALSPQIRDQLAAEGYGRYRVGSGTGLPG